MNLARGSPGTKEGVIAVKSLPSSVWITLALLAASAEPIVAKFAFRGDVAPLQLIVLKNTIGALFMLPLLKGCTGGKSAMMRLAPCGLLLFATNSLTLYSLKTLSVVLLITIVTCVPALVALLNNVLGRESLGPKFWLGFLMCFTGVVMTLEFKDLIVGGTGIACAVLAALSSSVYRVQIEILCEEYSPRTAATISYIFQGAATLLLLPWVIPFSSEAIVFGGWIGLSAALANLAFVCALNMVGSTRLSILTMLQRPLLIIAAALTLHENVSQPQLWGILLVMVGIQLAQARKSAELQAPVPTLVAAANKRAFEESSN